MTIFFLKFSFESFHHLTDRRCVEMSQNVL